MTAEPSLAAVRREATGRPVSDRIRKTLWHEETQDELLFFCRVFSRCGMFIAFMMNPSPLSPLFL